MDAKRRRSLAWDAVMVWLALLNLGLLLFDFTYLRFRPFYLRHAPVVTRIYDPVKGIEPQPLTSRYLELARSLGETSDPAERDATLAELRQLGHEAVDHRPFERVGQESEIRAFDQRVRSYVAERDGVEPSRLSSAAALDRFWRPGSEVELAATLAYFERELEPILAVNYYRAFDRDGDFVDHGWIVDLPFLLFFSVEFYGQWFLAYRRRRYAAWWVYPVMRWYDFLGILPLPQFRVFRLFRVVSLYLRLARSERSVIGEDIVSRALNQIASLLTEEVTQRVTVRILTASQEALAAGIQARITRAVLEPRKDLLVRELASAVVRAVTDSESRATARHLLDQALEQASESADGLRHLPLPRAMVEPIVLAVGRAVFDSVLQTLEATLQDEQGRDALDALVSEIVDSVIVEFTSGTGERLLREALVETLEHVKASVAVRGWAEPGR